MKILIAAAVAGLSVLPAAALAQTAAPTGVYGTLGYADAHTDGVDLGAIEGRLGYRFNNWLGVEGELAGGVKDDKSSQAVGGGTVDTKIKLQHEEAIYGVGFLPLSPQFDLLARVGYGDTRIKASATGTAGVGILPVSASQSVHGGSWNYGVGAQYHFDGKNGIRGDYTRQEFTGDNSGHADVWSIAYSRRF